MQPIGPLMHEHRLIERMTDLIRKQAELVQGGAEPEAKLIADAVEFFRVYADRCHHGKEEDLLFRELSHKKLPPELSAITDELIQEHKQGRAMVKSLYEANLAHVQSGDGAQELVGLLQKLAAFYPRHIEKEDKRFFFPIMEFFSRQEMDQMLQDFYEFDRKLIHDFFRAKVESYEKNR
ncbi:hemerythrin domain-containing protein [Desulfoferula mesophila]|uniref:Cation-binding protein n=1 Tax=Desulfoferula mesophila TaxID=3058419 RepID=A0AAU9EXN3_9BACT|nr:cation-binding protein [Desulfoferula mesophilus]